MGAEEENTTEPDSMDIRLKELQRNETIKMHKDPDSTTKWTKQPKALLNKAHAKISKAY